MRERSLVRGAREEKRKKGEGKTRPDGEPTITIEDSSVF